MKVAVIYASTTGNTEAMANAICDSLKEKGAEVLCATADEADQAAALSCDVLLLGSPAMGDEVLEDSVEEFFAAIEGSISKENRNLRLLRLGRRQVASRLGGQNQEPGRRPFGRTPYGPPYARSRRRSKVQDLGRLYVIRVKFHKANVRGNSKKMREGAGRLAATLALRMPR